MADQIKTHISFDGVAGILADLKALGVQGEKAFRQVQVAVAKVKLDQFASDIATVGKRLAVIGTALTAAAGTGAVALFSLAKSGSEAADAAGKAAQTTGLSVEAYGRLSHAADLADLSNEQFIAGMGRLNKAIAESAAQSTKAGGAISDIGVQVVRFGGKAKDAAKQVADTGNVFTKLGVKIRDANGVLRSNEAILQDVAQAFSLMPDGALKSALAIELFGKAGADMLPFLNAGKQGLIDLGKEAERTGLVFTKAQADIAENFNDTLTSLGKAARGVRVQLGLLFAPIFTTLAASLRDEINNNREAIVAFGQKAAQVTAGALGDLFHLLSGNTQNIKSPFIKEWGAAIVQFGSDVSGVFNGLVLPAFKALREGAQFVAEQINKVFGTDITAGELTLGAAVLSLVGAFSLLGSAIGVVVAGIGLLGGAAVAIAAAAFAAGVAIAVFWDDIQAGAAATWQFITDGATGAWAAIVQGATDLWAQIVEAFQAGQQMAVDAFNGIVEAIVAAWGGLTDRLGQIAQQIVDRIVAAFQGITARISAIFDGIVGIAQSVLGRVSSLVDSIISKIQSAIEFAKQLAGLGGDSGSASGGTTSGFASGGFVRGPGGPRTDSILARLSNGEFVVQARAVQRLGVDFLHALNNGFVPSLDGLKGFSLGGFVDNFNRSMQIPRFAGGGMVSALSAPAGETAGRTPLLLQFNGGEVIDDVTIGNIAMNRLQREAVKYGLTSTGRKPLRR